MTWPHEYNQCQERGPPAQTPSAVWGIVLSHISFISTNASRPQKSEWPDQTNPDSAVKEVGQIACPPGLNGISIWHFRFRNIRHLPFYWHNSLSVMSLPAFLLVQQKHAHWDSLLQALLVTSRNHFSVITPNTSNPSPNNTLHFI